MSRLRERALVAKLYPGRRWRKKVAKMSDAQVLAIFLKEKRRFDKQQRREGAMEPEEEERAARPMPCPECFSTKGYSRVGKFRVQCKGCNALLQNAEVNLEDLDPQ